MNRLAKGYIAGITIPGAGVLAYQLCDWSSGSLTKFILFLSVTLAGSLMKVRLPGITGTMSVHFLFLLIGLTQLSLPEILLLGTSAVTLQCIWHAKQRPKLIQILFNVGSTALSVYYAYLTFHWKPLSAADLGLPIQLAAASMVFFVMNTGLVAGVVAVTEGKAIHRTWHDCYFWCFPYYLLGAVLAGVFHYLSTIIGWQSALLTLPVVYIVYASYRMYLDKLENEKGHVEQVAALHLRTIEALALAIDAKDHTTHEHLERVQVFAMEMGKEMGLSKDELDALEAASLLHDIGKLAVPEHIISKPGKLTPEEFEKMKIHPIIGAEIIETVKFPYPVAPIVRAHHEKWDGTGYPNGLAGDDIPIGARILSVVDCMDALASDRPYRRAIPLSEAVNHIASQSGKSYDPRVVGLLQSRYKFYESMIPARTQVEILPKLSHDARVERGEAPGAGYERSACEMQKGISRAGASDYLNCIAGARQEAHTLFELAQSMGNTLSLQDTLSMMSARLHKLIHFDSLAVFVKDGNLIRPEYVMGVDSRFLSSLEIPIGQGLSGWVAENRTPILNGTPSVEAGYLNNVAVFSNLHSALAVPLINQDQLVGVLSVYSVERDAFSRDEVRVMQAIASKLAMSVENAKRFEHAESSATMDYLTGLPNARSLFLRLDEEISRAKRSAESLAVLVCDLDNFKQVNDRFGHLAGNEVLQAVASEMKSRFRGYDYVARMGGDEFVILLPNTSASRIASRVEELNLMVRDTSRTVCGEEVVSLSAGVAILGDDGTGAEDLLSAADRRMYENKAQARRSHSLCNLTRSSKAADLTLVN